MMGKLFNLLAVFAVATLLASGGFVGYLFGAGRLNPARVETIAAVLRGELDHPQAAEQPASRPATQPAAAPPERTTRSAEEIRQARVRDQLRRATLERAASDLAARQALLDQTLQTLITMQEEFEKHKTEWAEQRKKMAAAAQDEGFQRELEYVAKLTPKLAKEHIVRTWRKHKADAVRLLMALEPGKGKSILEQMKSPDEVGIMHELLEQLRLQDAQGQAAESGTTARNSAGP